MVGQSALNRSIGVRIPGGQPTQDFPNLPAHKSLFRISYLEIIRPKACKDVRLEPAFSVGAVAGIVRNKCALWKHNPGGLFRPAHSPMEPKPSRNVFQRHSDFPRDAQIGGSTADDSFKQLRTATETLGVFVLLVGDLGSHHSALSEEVFRGLRSRIQLLLLSSSTTMARERHVRSSIE